MIGATKLAVGGLSNPSKMPGFGYSLPAEKCGAGSKLREGKLENSGTTKIILKTFVSLKRVSIERT